MKTIRVTLPSGLGCEIRKLQTPELDILASPSAAHSPDIVGQIFTSVATGFYDLDEHIRPSELLVGDHTALLYYLRRWTYGDVIEYDWTCPHPTCLHPNQEEGDLSKLIVRPLPEESIQALTEGRLFKTTLPDSGAVVEFNILRGRDQTKLAKLRKQKKNELVTAILGYRVATINGKMTTDALIREYIEGYDQDWLMKHWETVDCGVDTAVPVVCEECRRRTEIEIPFGGKGFWSAAKTLKRTLTDGDGSRHQAAVSDR